MITTHARMLEMTDRILYLALTADRPRQIDRYIDYFGSGTELAVRSEATTARVLAHSVRGSDLATS